MEYCDEAEWDLQSIKRYEKLLMFEAEYSVRQMELVGGNSRLCCLGDKVTSSGSSTSVLTVYSLPPRLRTSDSKASLSPDFDLKIVAGTFNNNHITQIGCVGSSDWVVASERGADELLVYKLNTNQSDKLVMSGVLNCEGLTNPNISATSDFIVASKHSDNRISIIDIKSKAETGKRMWSGGQARLSSLIIDPHVFLIYSSDDATAAIFDTRQQQTAAFVQGGSGETVGWSAGCGYEEGTNTGTGTVAFLSNSGNARFYDLKHLDKAYSHVDLGSSVNQTSKSTANESNGKTSSVNESRVSVKMNPLNNTVAAVGGLDSRIYILDTVPNCCITFNHDGHEHMESSLGRDTRTTSHLFYSPGAPNTLVSSSDNSSINCWAYNTT